LSVVTTSRGVRAFLQQRTLTGAAVGGFEDDEEREGGYKRYSHKLGGEKRGHRARAYKDRLSGKRALVCRGGVWVAGL
jgi:hypothetical protein